MKSLQVGDKKIVRMHEGKTLVVTVNSLEADVRETKDKKNNSGPI